MSWVRSKGGPRMVHWRTDAGVLLCSETRITQPRVVEPAEVNSVGNPLGQICDLCRARLQAGKR